MLKNKENVDFLLKVVVLGRRMEEIRSRDAIVVKKKFPW